jgi:hypothetical protein
VIVRRGRPPVVIECNWSAGEFDPAGIKVFRAAYPEGRNLVVSADVTPGRSYERTVGSVTVRFAALAELATELKA